MRNSVAKPSISLFRGNLPQLFFPATSSFLQRTLQTHYYFYYKLTSVHSLHSIHSFTHARQTHTHNTCIQNRPHYRSDIHQSSVNCHHMPPISQLVALPSSFVSLRCVSSQCTNITCIRKEWCQLFRAIIAEFKYMKIP